MNMWNWASLGTWRCGCACVLWVLTLGAMVVTADAQCVQQWVYGPEQRFPGVDRTAMDVAAWDPDGAGPLGTHVVAVGNFGAAGDIRASGVAKWDGTRWSTVGSGISGELRRVCVYEGNLYVAGLITLGSQPAFEGIARFDGQQWSTIGVVTGPGQVYAMVVAGPYLVAAGSFTQFNSEAVSRIALLFNGTWSGFDAGLNGDAYALAYHQNAIVVGGAFTEANGVPTSRVARYVNGLWQPMSNGLNGNVWTLQVFENQVYAGGTFSQDGFGNTMRLLARFNGTAWFPVNGFASTGWVQSLHVDGNALFVGGTLPNIGGVAPGGLAKVSGGVLQRVGAGPGQSVTGMASFNGRVILAGGGGRGTGIGELNPSDSTYRPLLSGRRSDINGLVPLRGEMIFEGYVPADGAMTDRTLWTFNGESSRRFSDDSPFDIRASAVFNGELYVGGLYTGAGPENAAGLARWDGQAWRKVGTGLNSNAMVHALCVYQGELIVGGCFTTAGGIVCRGFAAWNGTSWRVPAMTDGCVYALKEFGGELFVGGVFNTIGSIQTVKNLARWDGTAWRTAGPGMLLPSDPNNAHVYDFEEYQGKLIACGRFSIAGGSWAHGVAQWTPATGWQPMANDVQTPSSSGALPIVNAMEVLDGRLYAVGSMEYLGSVRVNNLGVWNGQAWSALGQGLDFEGRTIVRRARELYIGGRFALADGRVSPNFARYGCPCRADLNADSMVNTDDLFEFLNDWFLGDLRADFNAIRGLDVADIFDFLNAWFVGCE